MNGLAKALLAAIVACSPSVGQAGEQPPQTDTTLRVPTLYGPTFPGWLRVPSLREFERAAPIEALNAGLTGRTILFCSVDADGGLIDCIIDREDHPGAGFGSAALELADKFRMKTKKPDGSPVAGETVKIPIRFVAPRSQLQPTVDQVVANIQQEIRELAPRAKVFAFGAVHRDPANLVIWATTPWDRERNRLAADDALIAKLQALLRDEGYPTAAIPAVELAFQSEETVRRDYGGDWWAAIRDRRPTNSHDLRPAGTASEAPRVASGSSGLSTFGLSSGEVLAELNEMWRETNPLGGFVLREEEEVQAGPNLGGRVMMACTYELVCVLIETAVDGRVRSALMAAPPVASGAATDEVIAPHLFLAKAVDSDVDGAIRIFHDQLERASRGEDNEYAPFGQSCMMVSSGPVIMTLFKPAPCS